MFKSFKELATEAKRVTIKFSDTDKQFVWDLLKSKKISFDSGVEKDKELVTLDPTDLAKIKGSLKKVDYVTEEITSTSSIPAEPVVRKKKKKCSNKEFSVSPDVFRRFQTGRNKFERWTKFLDKNDELQNEIYSFIKANRESTVILRCNESGAMISLRRRSANGI